MTLRLRIEGSRSLKDRRQVVRSLKDRLRKRFNVSVAEVGEADSWTLATIAVAVVAAQASRVETILQSVEREAEEQLGGDLEASEIELM